jgi:hypothetical protein
VAKVQSSVTFPVAITQIADGTPERVEFESGLKASLAAEVGGGGIFTAADIVIDGITAAAGAGRRLLMTSSRRRQQSAGVDVEWHIETPPEVMGVVANLVATVAETSADITVSVGGVELAAAAVAPPTVFKEPDVDCVGSWLECDTDCKQYFEITMVASGYGADCETIHGAERACSVGEGACTGTAQRDEDGALQSDDEGGEVQIGLAVELLIAVGAAGVCVVLVCATVACRLCRRRAQTPKATQIHVVGSAEEEQLNVGALKRKASMAKTSVKQMHTDARAKVDQVASDHEEVTGQLAGKRAASNLRVAEKVATKRRERNRTEGDFVREARKVATQAGIVGPGAASRRTDDATVAARDLIDEATAVTAQTQQRLELQRTASNARYTAKVAEKRAAQGLGEVAGAQADV